MYNRFCLSCGKPINNNELWHKKCLLDFFGSENLPSISLNINELEKVAITQINEEKSVAGVQEKLSLHLDLEIKNQPRLTILGLPSGYILKPQSPKYNRLPEFEHTAMLLAELCELQTVKHGLVPLNDNQFAYITKRIDRNDKEKIHMEDFCQASGNLTQNKYRYSYEQCANLIAKNSSIPTIDKIKFFTSLYFNFVIGNSDMHLKNFSFIMDENGKLSLSPFYDLLPTKVILQNDHEDLGMLFNNKKMDLCKKDFDTFALNIGINEITKNKIINHINNKFEAMCEIIDNSLLDQNSKIIWKKMISANIRRASK